MPAAILFDIDDLLADTEALHFRAYRRALAEAGVRLRECDYADHWIRKGGGIVDFCRLRSLTHDPTALRLRKADVYQALLARSLRPMPGAMAALERFANGYRLAAATSAFADAARAVLDGLQMARFFEVVVTGSDVQHPKPAPDIFLKAAAGLHVAPAECVVLEDAEKGVQAARAAGMKVIAVPSRLTRGNDFSAADRVVGSLDEVTIEMVENLQ